jgi:hypothetical protein
MGYRTYIGSMPKREYNKIKSMSREQLIEHYKLEVEEDENYLGMGVYDFGECLYEFGKYTDFEPPKKSIKTFFKNKELNKYFTEEHDFNIVTKEFLEYIIESYKKRISDYYNDMMNPFFEVKNGVFEREKPCEFLNSIKTDYKYPENDITFDFTKITQQEQNALFKIIEHVRSMRTEWTCLTPYNLENGDSITSSWKYEYGIFELVRIYKSFDWKRNVMIYYGY